MGASCEEISALLRERQVGAGRMHDQIAALDSRLHGGRILVVSAAYGNELRIDGADLHPAGMVGLNPVRGPNQFGWREDTYGGQALKCHSRDGPSDTH